MAERRPTRIVVGVDGSLNARAALRWAVEHARPIDTVIVTHAWTASPAMVDAGLCDPDDDSSARALVSREIEHVRALAEELGLHLEREVVHGKAESVLCGFDADLIVVGACGRGAVARRLLGSVSDHVTRHAHRPVVIVPMASRSPRPGAGSISVGSGIALRRDQDLSMRADDDDNS